MVTSNSGGSLADIRVCVCVCVGVRGTCLCVCVDVVCLRLEQWFLALTFSVASGSTDECGRLWHDFVYMRRCSSPAPFPICVESF